MKNAREKIPAPLKRKVRQRCGFSCVICGTPIYDYEHIVEYSKVKTHNESNITLLCPQHHREKTNNLLSMEKVKKANKNPFNKINKLSSPYNFHFEGTNFELIMGDCTLSLSNINPKIDYIIPFLINNKKVISFEIIDYQLFFNLVVFNEKGDLLLKIIENEMEYNSEQWDVEFVGTRLKLRTGLREILFDIEFNIPNGVIIHRGRFSYDGYTFEVKDGGFHSKNLQVFCKNIRNYRVVFAVGEYNGKDPVAIRSKIKPK